MHLSFRRGYGDFMVRTSLRTICTELYVSAFAGNVFREEGLEGYVPALTSTKRAKFLPTKQNLPMFKQNSTNDSTLFFQ